MQMKNKYVWYYLKTYFPFFHYIKPEFIPMIASSLKPKEYNMDEVIFNQGDSGNFMWFIVSGSVSVSVDNKIISHLSVFDCFGESALSNNSSRNSTIIASQCKWLHILLKLVNLRIRIIENSYWFMV